MNNLPFEIKSIKCSVKIPSQCQFELDWVRQRCLSLNINFTSYPNFLVFSTNIVDSNLPGDYNHKVKYTLFRYSRKSKSEVNNDGQHCNIAGLTKFHHIHPAIESLANLLQIDHNQLSCVTDNLNALAKLPTKINKSKFIESNPQVFQQFERFPAIFLKTDSKVVILLYASGSCVFSGAKTISQIEEAAKYLWSCFVKYKSINP